MSDAPGQPFRPVTGPGPDPAGLRRSYRLAGLLKSELADTWHGQFRSWFDAAVAAGGAAGVVEANAMVLGTVSADGVPSARTVLLKGFDAEGFVFHTNRLSRKGRELAAVGRASLLFPWYGLERQVVVTGRVRAADDPVSDAYFASRPRGSQLGAWASPQSEVVSSREVLAGSLAGFTARYDGLDVPRPPHWGGYVVAPDTVEFWQGREDRMHDRLVFRRSPTGEGPGGFEVRRLAP